MTDTENTSTKFFGKAFFAERLFAKLSSDSQKRLSKISRNLVFAKKSLIYQVGDCPECLYILKTGEAKLFLHLENKTKCVVRQIHQGEILGLPETLGNFLFETGVEAISVCSCDCIYRDDFLDFLQADATLSFQLLTMLSSNLQTSYRQFTGKG